jgi:CMP-N,N'-diacetyllegionaminic acid synthase
VRTLGLIPARGGSKGVPGKNLGELANRPLLAHTANHASGAVCLDATMLSTDLEELAVLGRSLGLDVPFLRPADLARDDTPMIDVVRHALGATDASYDIVVLLQPTSPVRAPDLIDRCWQELVDSGPSTTCVTTVSQVPSHHHPDWLFAMDGAGRLSRLGPGSTITPSRQELPPRWFRTGQVYAFWAATAREHPDVLGPTPRGLAVEGPIVNIDTPDDWSFAEWVLGGDEP